MSAETKSHSAEHQHHEPSDYVKIELARHLPRRLFHRRGPKSESKRDHHSHEAGSVESGHESELKLSREQLRDKDAIDSFIAIRNYYVKHQEGQDLLNSVNIASREAAPSYWKTISLPEAHWGVEPKLPDTPDDSTSPGHKSSLYEMQITLPAVELSDDFKAKLEEARNEEIARVNEHYKHNGTEEGRQEALAKIDAEYKDYQQGKHIFHDREKQMGPDEKKHFFVYEDRGAKAKELLDYASPAIEASNAARDEALRDKKSLKEAMEIGAEKYEEIMQKMLEKSGAKMSLEDRRTAAAIKAFNEVRDQYVRPGDKHGKFEDGMVLHNAADAYEHTMHQPLDRFKTREELDAEAKKAEAKKNPHSSSTSAPATPDRTSSAPGSNGDSAPPPPAPTEQPSPTAEQSSEDSTEKNLEEAKEIIESSEKIKKLVNKASQKSFDETVASVTNRRNRSSPKYWIKKIANKRAQTKADKMQDKANKAKGKLNENRRTKFAEEAKAEAAKRNEALQEIVSKNKEKANEVATEKRKKHSEKIGELVDKKAIALADKAIRAEAQRQKIESKEIKAILKEFSHEDQIKIGRIAFATSKEQKNFETVQKEEITTSEQLAEEKTNLENTILDIPRFEQERESYTFQANDLEDAILEDSRTRNELVRASDPSNYAVVSELATTIDSNRQQVIELRRKSIEAENNRQKSIQEQRRLNIRVKYLEDSLKNKTDKRVVQEQKSTEATKDLADRIAQIKSEADAKNNNEGDK